MSKQHLVLMVSCFFIVLGHARAAADVTVRYGFSEPAIETLEGGFSRLVFPATMQAGRVGEPSFPFRGGAVLLPSGEAVASVRIEGRGWKIIDGHMRLYPYQPPVPGSAAPVQGAQRRFHYKTDVYAQDRWINPPDPVFETRYLCGHPIATARLLARRVQSRNGRSGLLDGDRGDNRDRPVGRVSSGDEASAQR